jgi:hypothetical protein
MKATALAIVAIHFVVVVLHSIAHQKLPVDATPAQLAFIVPVIVVAPLIAAMLLLKFEKAGMVLLTVSMLGSLIFGVYYHLIADTIDHVGRVAYREPHFWSQMFVSTSYLLALSEAAAVAVGLLWLTRQTQRRSFL